MKGKFIKKSKGLSFFMMVSQRFMSSLAFMGFDSHAKSYDLNRPGLISLAVPPLWWYATAFGV